MTAEKIRYILKKIRCYKMTRGISVYSIHRQTVQGLHCWPTQYQDPIIEKLSVNRKDHDQSAIRRIYILVNKSVDFIQIVQVTLILSEIE